MRVLCGAGNGRARSCRCTTCACPWQNYILWSHGGEPDGACEVLKLGSTFTTAFLLVFLYVWHMRKFEHAQFTNALLQRDTFMSSGILAEFVVRMDDA